MPIPFSPGDSVFGYGRDSGGDQQDLSIEQQESALRSWCLEQQLILSHFYKDEARKGSSIVGRDGLQTMMHQFRHGCSERGVIVWKYNRFARSVDNAQYFRAEIRTLGYIFHSITDHVPEGPMGRLFEAAIDFKDEQFLIDLSMDIKRGLGDLVRVYGCVPGTPPKGFIRVPLQIGIHRDGSPHIGHRWRPDPDLINRIHEAFELRSNLISLSDIQKETHLFKAINSWRTFFSNPLYTGILQYGDQRIENYCEPIVSRDLWDRVQVIQNKYQHRRNLTSDNVDHPRRANSRFILSGLVRCTLCDSPLFGHTAVQRNKNTVDSYSCGRHYRNRDCPARRIPKSTLEEAVLATLHNQILKPEVFAQTYELLSRSQSSILADQSIRRQKLVTEFGTIRRQLTNVADGIAQNGPSQTLNERLALLESQRLGLETKIAALDATGEQPVPEYSIDQLKLLIERIDIALHAVDKTYQRFILRALIECIVVARDGNTVRGTIFYFYPPPDLDPKSSAPDTVPLLLHTPGALH